jgi:hypothetical protein
MLAGGLSKENKTSTDQRLVGGLQEGPIRAAM